MGVALQVLCIASILGEAFWEQGQTEWEAPAAIRSITAAVGRQLFGLQLMSQQLWMHCVWQDSTITLLATSEAEEVDCVAQHAQLTCAPAK